MYLLQWGEAAFVICERNDAVPARRILIIAPTSFFADYGCHVRILEHARGLAERGHDVTICTYHSGRDVDGLRIYRTPQIPWRKSAEVGSSWHKLLLDAFLFVLVLRVALRRRPQLLHAYLHEGALIGAIIGWCLRIPLLFDFQGSLTSEILDHRFLCESNPMLRPLQRLERWINRQPAIILANSYHSADLLVRRFAVATERIHVVPDCVDTDRFNPLADGLCEDRERLKADWGIPPETLVIVYLGLLAPYQGIDLLLNAMQMIQSDPNIHLLIMGFPNVERYRRLSRELGIANRITFPGVISYHEAHRMLAAGDIAVGPKISETEGSGKLLTYMAMGLPTVAFDTPVSREYLGDAGVLVPPGDVTAFSRAMMCLARTPDERTERGAALRRRAIDHFHCTVALDAIESAYARIEHEAGDRVDRRQF